MKKIIHFLIAVLLLCSFSLSVFAFVPDYQSATTGLKFYGDMDFTISSGYSKIPEFLDKAFSISELLNSSHNIKFSCSPDFKRVQFEVISQSLQNTVVNHSWYDLSLADPKDPDILHITKPSDSDIYYYRQYDSSNLNSSDYEKISYIQNQEKLVETREKLFFNLDTQITTPVYHNGEFILSLDDFAVKAILKNYLHYMSSSYAGTYAVLSEYLQSGGQGFASSPDIFVSAATKDNLKLYESAVNDFFENIKDTALLGENGITEITRIDEGNVLAQQIYRLDIKANIYDLMKAAGLPEGLLSDKITPENAVLEIFCDINIQYNSLNNKFSIVLPVLDASNSIDISNTTRNDYYDINKTNILLDNKLLQFRTEPIIENDRVLVPLEEFWAHLDIDEGNMDITNDFLIIRKDENKIRFSLQEAKVIFNETEMELDVSAKLVDHAVFVPLRFLSVGLGYDIEWTPLFDNENNQTGGMVYISSPPSAEFTLFMPAYQGNINEFVKVVTDATFCLPDLKPILTSGSDVYLNIINHSANSTLPAAMVGSSISKNDFESLVEMGAITPLDDYINNYAPNICDMLNKNPQIAKALMQADGKIYSLPRINGERINYYAAFIPINANDAINAIAWIDYLYSAEGAELCKRYPGLQAPTWIK